MTEDYIYQDIHSMINLHDTLEELLSKRSTIGFWSGSQVYTNPSPDLLMRILFTPVNERCIYLKLGEDESYKDILKDVENGTYQNFSIKEFEKKRKEWINDILKTENPILRISKAIQYGRKVNTWETQKHFLDLVSDNKGTLMHLNICFNMIKKGYSLSQIAEIITDVGKADIYAVSILLKMPLELSPSEYKEVEKEYRKTGRPPELKEIFENN